MTKIMGRDSATGRSTAHRAGAGGDNTGGVIASGVVGDLATHWVQAAARAAAAGDVRAGGQAAHRLAAPGPVATGITAGPTAGGAETARSVAGGARAGGLRAGGLTAHRLAVLGPAAAGDAASSPAAAGTTAGPTAGGAAAARDAARGAAADRLAALGPATAGHTTAGAAAGGPAAGGLAAAGAAAGLLPETSATALVRADRATAGADHGVRGWRFWVGFQESEFQEFGSLLVS